jgi:hypothetical protein
LENVTVAPAETLTQEGTNCVAVTATDVVAVAFAAVHAAGEGAGAPYGDPESPP